MSYYIQNWRVNYLSDIPYTLRDLIIRQEDYTKLNIINSIEFEKLLKNRYRINDKYEVVTLEKIGITDKSNENKLIYFDFNLKYRNNQIEINEYDFNNLLSHVLRKERYRKIKMSLLSGKNSNIDLKINYLNDRDPILVQLGLKNNKFTWPITFSESKLTINEMVNIYKAF